MRLDRFLSDAGLGTRKHVKKAIRAGHIKIDGKPVLEEAYNLDPEKEKVTADDQPVEYHKEIFLLMNKPEGYLCSTIDEEGYLSVLNLIDPSYQKRARIVGRLDVDTTGVLLITDDGKLNNRLIHPKQAIEKEYHAELNHSVRQEDLDAIMSKGVNFGEDDLIKPKKIVKISDQEVSITVTEGKYHEIKRIFHHFGYDVIKLDRVRLGFLTYEGVERGQVRPLTAEEILKLRKYLGMPGKEE
jgi:16S rRNA pseudouridine516 synthase